MFARWVARPRLRGAMTSLGWLLSRYLGHNSDDSWGTKHRLGTAGPGLLPPPQRADAPAAAAALATREAPQGSLILAFPPVA